MESPEHQNRTGERATNCALPRLITSVHLRLYEPRRFGLFWVSTSGSGAQVVGPYVCPL